MAGVIRFLLADTLPAGYVPDGATFALLHQDGLRFEVLATDGDVPVTVYPETFAAELAVLRDAEWDVEYRQENLLYHRVGDHWEAWDSHASTEDEPIPTGCRYPVPGEVGDFVVGAVPVPVGVAS